MMTFADAPALPVATDTAQLCEIRLIVNPRKKTSGYRLTITTGVNVVADLRALADKIEKGE